MRGFAKHLFSQSLWPQQHPQIFLRHGPGAALAQAHGAQHDTRKIPHVYERKTTPRSHELQTRLGPSNSSFLPPFPKCWAPSEVHHPPPQMDWCTIGLGSTWWTLSVQSLQYIGRSLPCSSDRELVVLPHFFTVVPTNNDLSPEALVVVGSFVVWRVLNCILSSELLERKVREAIDVVQDP